MTRPYDPSARAAAARLQHTHPHWLILYGPGTRRFYAFPRFRVRPGTIATATSTSELLQWMRTTELDARPGPPWPAPATRTGG